MTAASPVLLDHNPCVSRARLVDEIDPDHQLPDSVRRAMLTVPRHPFVPAQFWAQLDLGGAYEPIDRYSHPDLWWEVVHSDRTLVLQYDDGQTVWPEAGTRVTCSIPQPHVVATMLAELDVQPDDNVLEIGTGSGYGGALLGHLAETGQVVTVEIDPRTARTASHIYRKLDMPNVAVWTNDGAQPLMPIARRWDKVLSTASAQVGRLPYSWISESTPGAVIVTPMHTDLSTGPLVRWEVCGDGTATGYAHPDARVAFMELRSHRLPRAAGQFPLDYDTNSSVDVATSELDPRDVLLDSDHCWPVALAVPSCHLIRESSDPHLSKVLWLSDPVTGSWARSAPATLSEGHFTVYQHGPRRLWDEVETAYRWRLNHGSPSLDQWQWHVTATTQTVRLPE